MFTPYEWFQFIAFWVLPPVTMVGFCIYYWVIGDDDYHEALIMGALAIITVPIMIIYLSRYYYKQWRERQQEEHL
jgi:membrane protein YdbS with pleckstrin-like domain